MVFTLINKILSFSTSPKNVDSSLDPSLVPSPKTEKKTEKKTVFDDNMKQFKIIITGDGGVGKTSYVNKLGNDSFYRTYIPTMGVNVISLKTNTNTGKTYIMNLWDTAGQEKFGGLRDAYYRGCDGCLILFGLDDKTTFKNVNQWYREIIRICDNIPIVLAGTKSDIPTTHNRSHFRVNNINKKNLYFSTFLSSKSGENIFLPLEHLLRKLEDDDTIKITKMTVI